MLFVDDAVIDEEILVASGTRCCVSPSRSCRRCQQLLSMLISDPPHPYAEIHAKLGILVGSIGPQRGRCLDRLRRSSALVALGEGEQKIDIREASQVRNGWDDEQLMAALGEAMRAREAVPSGSSRRARTLSPGTTSTPSWRSSPTTPARIGARPR